MNITKHTLGAAAIAAALTIGGASGALAGGSSDGANAPDHSARLADVCADPDAVVARITEHQTRLGERITTLTDLRAKATTAGRDKLAAKIERRIESLQTRLDGVTARLDKAPAWIAEHCA